MAFWRGLSGGGVMFAILVLRHGHGFVRQVRQTGAPGLGLVSWSVAGTLTFAFAVRWSTVADAAAVYAAMPFLTAALAWFVWRMPSSRSTLIAAGVAALGVGATMLGTADSGTWTGAALMVVSTGCFALQCVLLRRHPAVPVPIFVMLTSLLCAALMWPLSSRVAVGEVLVLVLSGVIQGTLGDWMFARGAQLLAPSRTALLATLDLPIGTVVAWLVLAEAPSAATLVGGGIVVAAVAGNVLWDLRGRPQQAG